MSAETHYSLYINKQLLENMMTAMARLEKRIEEAGGIRKAAAKLEISSSYLSDLMNRKRGVSVEFAARVEATLGIKALELLRWQAAEDWRVYQERKGNTK